MLTTHMYVSTSSITPALLSPLPAVWLTSNYEHQLSKSQKQQNRLITGPKSLLCSAQNISLLIGVHTVSPFPTVWNLGNIFDSALSFQSLITRKSFFHLRNIDRFYLSLPHFTAQILVHSFITSRLDNCKSILHGLPSTHLQTQLPTYMPTLAPGTTSPHS